MNALPKAILFDLGQVLLRYDEHLVFEAIQRLEPSVSPYEVFGDPESWRLQELAESGELSPADKRAQLNRIFGLDLPEADWASAWAAGCTGPVPGMPELMARLRVHFTLGCLSNTVPWHWAAGLAQVPGLRELPHHFLSFELGCRKPGARIYELCLARLALPAERVLFIDDRSENVEGARAAGMKAVRFEGCGGLVEALDRMGVVSGRG